MTLPVVSISAEPLLVAEGLFSLITFNLSQPAPTGGLEVRFTTDDLDRDTQRGDSINFFGGLLTKFTGINDLELISGGRGRFSEVSVTIAEGATRGILINLPLQDNIPEGSETVIYNLVERPGYIVDPQFQPTSLTITDEITVPTGNKTLFGTSQAEVFNALDGNNLIYGNGGEDLFLGGTGNNQFFGSSSNEYFLGSSGNETIYGNGGQDFIDGGPGNDLIFGGSGADSIFGFDGNDTIYGNGGQDFIDGETGDDLIFGGSDADSIFGFDGNDTIYGNGGADFIDTGAGFDTVWLGGGAARVVLSAGDGFDTVNNFQLGATRFVLDSLNNLSFTDSASGVEISQNNDLLAVVSWQTASTFRDNVANIFSTTA